MKHRIVKHVNQQVTEYYEWNDVLGEFQRGNVSISYDWMPSYFEYIELRHSMDSKIDGSYGHIIIG